MDKTLLWSRPTIMRPAFGLMVDMLREFITKSLSPEAPLGASRFLPKANHLLFDRNGREDCLRFNRHLQNTIRPFTEDLVALANLIQREAVRYERSGIKPP